MLIQSAQTTQLEDIARLVNLAGFGLPKFLWGLQAGLGEDELDIGRRLLEREDSGFSYRNVRVCLEGDEILGMALAFRLPDQIDIERAKKAEPWLRPILMLEAEVLGSWYLHSMAAFPQYRGKGVGTALLADSEVHALRAGCELMSLVVESENHSARSLYEHHGFSERSGLPLVPWPDSDHEGEFILMTRQLH